jgi:hypothetical protein
MAACGGRSAPYLGAVDLKAAPEPEPAPAPARAHPSWIRPLTDYERRESSWMHGARFG